MAIILMVFAHTMPGETINTWIFAFHMPLFFIVSGILIAWKFGEEKESASSLKKDLKKRLFQLGIPYCVFSFLLAGYYGILQYLAGEVNQMGTYLFKVVTMQGIDSLWFLPCYFVAEVVMKVTLFRPLIAHVVGIVTICALVLYFICVKETPDEWWCRFVLKVCVCYAFVYIGYELMKIRVVERLHFVVACMSLLICSGLALYNGFSAIGSLQLNNPVLFFINATGLTFMWFYFFHKDEARKWFDWLSFFGKNSMVILCTNNLLIEVIRLLDYRWAGGILLANGICGSICFTVMIIGLEIPLVYCASNTRLSILFGKRI